MSSTQLCQSLADIFCRLPFCICLVSRRFSGSPTISSNNYWKVLIKTFEDSMKSYWDLENQFRLYAKSIFEQCSQNWQAVLKSERRYLLVGNNRMSQKIPKDTNRFSINQTKLAKRNPEIVPNFCSAVRTQGRLIKTSREDLSERCIENAEVTSRFSGGQFHGNLALQLWKSSQKWRWRVISTAQQMSWKESNIELCLQCAGRSRRHECVLKVKIANRKQFVVDRRGKQCVIRFAAD